MNVFPVVVTGGLVGGGVALFVRELLQPQPALAAALARSAPGTLSMPEAEVLNRDEVWGRWLLARLERLPGVKVPVTNLALLGQGPGTFMLKKTALAGLGLLCPVLVTIPWIIAGISLPFYVPAVVGLVIAGLLFITPDLAVRDQAKRAREEFAHALSAYLDLVALKRAADAGPTEALEKAAAVGHGWPFLYLQGALRRARLEKIPPYQALTELADTYDLPGLSDVADIMRGSATDGAAVYKALRARTAALNTELLTAQAAEANAASEKMTAPGALLAVLVMLLMAFPAVIRMLTV
ncbi:type II secretion system F family protein [Streptomyces sp. NBC_00140]|uniref:type II secretion system F family protein n=1 Tax=Streptomyces sp. NBC_00140 TaxID=2975664 RepID=UPI002253B607|nr:type II secretion system F family protein [Streptomyces sp. NBC_00140]MCX5327805.1 type II secretion system F family protein [Streptomyces sp. NBC_00140]MCX5336828.1 type II secretion system F family protein [Streptomyces sp. NBC_00140]